MNDIKEIMKDIKKYIKENQISIEEIINNKQEEENIDCFNISFSIDDILKQMQNKNLIIDNELLKEKLVNKPIIHNDKVIGVIIDVYNDFIYGVIYKYHDFETFINDKNEVKSVSIELMDKKGE